MGDMKYWVEEGDSIIHLNGDEGALRVLSIDKEMNGNVEFMEMCDNYFAVNMPKEQAIEALEEAIQWLKT